MAYTKTNWLPRLREFTNRIQLTLVSGTTYDVAQVEGTVTQAGVALSPDNLNKIEEGIRVANLAASETVVGLVELATPAETTTGTDTTRAVHPAGLKVNTETKITNSTQHTVNDFLVASGAGAFVKKTLAEVKTILGLGTAAFTPITDYATAAQGTLATNALPAASYTAADVLTKIKTVDGNGSGLDADLLDGYHAAAAATASTVMVRDAAGRAKVVAPSATTDIALKSTVTADIATHLAVVSTESVKGHVELADPTETAAGTSSTLAVHPAGLKVVTDTLQSIKATFSSSQAIDAAADYALNIPIGVAGKAVAQVRLRNPSVANTGADIICTATIGDAQSLYSDGYGHMASGVNGSLAGAFYPAGGIRVKSAVISGTNIVLTLSNNSAGALTASISGLAMIP